MFVLGPSQADPRLVTIVGPKHLEVDATRNHKAGYSSPHLFRNDDDCIGKARDDPTTKTLEQPPDQHVTPVQGDNKWSLQPEPCRERRLTVMCMDDVVVDPARPP